MRRDLAVALFALVSACGGWANQFDVSGLVGSLVGTAIVTAGGPSSVQSGVGTNITADGSELTIGGICPDGSGPSATASSKTEFTIIRAPAFRAGPATAAP